jgi:hypothetical protein
VATNQVKLGDFIRIDRNSTGEITFTRQAEGALVPVLLERYGSQSVRYVEAKAKRARYHTADLISARNGA